MAFDYGKKRIGVAIGQTVSRTATALKVLTAKQGNPQWREVGRLIDEWAPDLLVVGMPVYEGRQAHVLRAEIERFSRRLSGRYSLPVEFIDERLSSFAAACDGVTDRLDAGAAKMILLTWLENPTQLATAGS
jgi:putative pre-16S rRNA nuclease